MKERDKKTERAAPAGGVVDGIKKQAGAQRERLRQWSQDRKRKGKKMSEERMKQDGVPQDGAPEQEAAAADQEALDAQQAPQTQATAPDAAEWEKKLGEAEQKIVEAEQKIEEYLNLAQRVQADFDNFRRRNNAVRAEAYDEGKRDAVKELLPVLDNIERALASAGEEESALRTGVEMVHRGLMETLKRLGVEAIDRLGEPFDPELENAVLQGGADEGDPGTVCAVLQKGYRVGNRVLRHAMVKVVAG